MGNHPEGTSPAQEVAHGISGVLGRANKGAAPGSGHQHRLGDEQMEKSPREKESGGAGPDQIWNNE